MTCECGASRWDTYDSRPKDDHIWRRKTCLYCGKKVTTHERIVHADPTTVEVTIKEYEELKTFRAAALDLLTEAVTRSKEHQ